MLTSRGVRATARDTKLGLSGVLAASGLQALVRCGAHDASVNKNLRVAVLVQRLTPGTRHGRSEDVGRRAFALDGGAAAVVLAERAVFRECGLVCLKRFFEGGNEVVLKECIGTMESSCQLSYVTRSWTCLLTREYSRVEQALVARLCACVAARNGTW